MKKWINPLERTIIRKQENQQRRRGDSVVGSIPDPVVWHLTRDPNEFSLFTVILRGQFQKHDFETKVEPKVPPSGPTFCLCFRPTALGDNEMAAPIFSTKSQLS